MAGRVLTNLLSVSTSFVLVVLGVSAISVLARKKISAQLDYLLWAAAVVQLPLQLALMSAWQRLGGTSPELIIRNETDMNAVAQAFAEVAPVLEMPVTIPQAIGGNAGHSLPLAQVILFFWLAGAALFFISNLLGHLQARKVLLRWSLSGNRGEIEPVLDVCLQRMGVGRRLPVYVNPSITSPLLLGTLRPVILLPDMEMNRQQLYCVFCHELAHYRRKDVWVKLALLVAQGLFWFHPLVWLVSGRAAERMELACDEEVLRTVNDLSAREYGLSILSFAAAGKNRPLPMATSLSGRRKSILKRFENIVRQAPGRPKLAASALCVAAVVCCTLLWSGNVAAATQKKEEAPQASRPSIITTVKPVEDIVVLEDAPDQMNLEELERLYLADVERHQREQVEFEEKLYPILSRADADAVYAGGELRWPVPDYYNITSYYGWRFNGSDFHTGLDISGGDIRGADVVAAAAGTVLLANTEHTQGVGYGIYIIIDHGSGITTVYGQLEEAMVKDGDPVSAGQVIGKVGSTGWSTGPHLHFEVRENGTHTNPATYLLPQE